MRTTHYCYFEPRWIYKLLAGGRADVERVQEMLSEFFAKPVLLLNSARTGIHLALATHGVTRRDEVLVPPFLGECVLNTINRTGFPALEFSPRTRALLAVHQFGYPQKMENIVPFARAHGLLLIEDCAFSFLSSYSGYPAASYGDVAVFATRFLAGARTLISFPAGASKMSFVRFSLLTLAGCFIWNGALIYAGYVLSEHWTVITLVMRQFYLPIALSVAIGLAYLFVARYRARSK